MKGKNPHLPTVNHVVKPVNEKPIIIPAHQLNQHQIESQIRNKKFDPKKAFQNAIVFVKKQTGLAERRNALEGLAEFAEKFNKNDIARALRKQIA